MLSRRLYQKRTNGGLKVWLVNEWRLFGVLIYRTTVEVTEG